MTDMFHTHRRPWRLLIVTDAWHPQINGVVRTYEKLTEELRHRGHDVFVLEGSGLRRFPCPTYPEIRLALRPFHHVAHAFRAFRPDVIHIATEGPLGLAARNYCLHHGLNFTTAYHTKFPEYIHARTAIPARWTLKVYRWFHSPATRVMVPTWSLKDELAAAGFGPLALWSRGVDAELFRPRPIDRLNVPHPVWLYVGRIAPEKNIEAFLALELEGTKVVVGAGPYLSHLKERFPDAHFMGFRSGDDLARIYAASDVFVFPSLTDTFGLVILEALASGLPVAAYPVTGPHDILGGKPVGCLERDLGRAARKALREADPATCRTLALTFSWARSTDDFLSHIVLNERPVCKNPRAFALTTMA